jgi:hypothetical protein
MAQAVRTSVQFRTVGRSYFHTSGQIIDVGFGKEVPVPVHHLPQLPFFTSSF